MTTGETTDLQLLLCDGEERRPLLGDGLPESSLLAAPAPGRGPRGRDSMHLEALDRDPNDLPSQRWAVIAPEGEAGDAMLAAITALIDHRGAQQGAEPLVFRVPEAMDAVASLRWKNDVLRGEELPADERPRYLLILGDLDRVSLELQHVLANGSFVGRLHCPTLAGYRDYAEKVVASERGPADGGARALFYTAQDGTAANRVGHRHLVAPCVAMTRDLAARGKLAIAGASEIAYGEWGPDELLATVAADAPSMLLSISHGLGAPRRGWRSVDHQRALQGALQVGGDAPLSADAVAGARFLPGGIWLCVACYGAGTPADSAFHPWLSLLAEQGAAPEQASAVLRALPRPGERPFVAALPQALLANPTGPLAVIGHMDLAWTFGFTDPGGKKSRASRMHAPQRAILGGSRVGVALDAMMHAYRETNDDLMARYQLQREAQARGRPDPVDRRLLGDLWMQRNDLRGYVLLGDPAARLAVAGERVGKGVAPPPEPEDSSKKGGRGAGALRVAETAQVIVKTETPPTEQRSSPRAAAVAVPAVAVPRVEQVRSTPSVAVPPVEQVPSMSAVPTVVSSMSSPPVAAHTVVVSVSGAQASAACSSDPELALRERAVLALLRGDEPARSVAARLGVPLDALFHWLDVYREAGRKVLGG